MRIAKIYLLLQIQDINIRNGRTVLGCRILKLIHIRYSWHTKAIMRYSFQSIMALKEQSYYKQQETMGDEAHCGMSSIKERSFSKI